MKKNNKEICISTSETEHGESLARRRISSNAVWMLLFLFFLLGRWWLKQLDKLKMKASTTPINGMNTAHSVSPTVKLDLWSAHQFAAKNKIKISKRSNSAKSMQHDSKIRIQFTSIAGIAKEISSYRSASYEVHIINMQIFCSDTQRRQFGNWIASHLLPFIYFFTKLMNLLMINNWGFKFNRLK